MVLEDVPSGTAYLFTHQFGAMTTATTVAAVVVLNRFEHILKMRNDKSNLIL